MDMVAKTSHALQSQTDTMTNLDNVYVELKSRGIGLPEQESLDERIRRAEHVPNPRYPEGKPISGDHGMGSHCWLCRRDLEQKEDAKMEEFRRQVASKYPKYSRLS